MIQSQSSRKPNRGRQDASNDPSKQHAVTLVAAEIEMLDETHHPRRRSWVATANGHPDFPIQNLPVGIFSRGGSTPRGGFAIGDMIFDIGAAVDAGVLSGQALAAARLMCRESLNEYLELPDEDRKALRSRISGLLSQEAAGDSEMRRICEALLVESDQCTMHLPTKIGDYTDFFAGIHHARAAGRILRGAADVNSNYKYVPIGYHGRASSVRASGQAVTRPYGQIKPAADQAPVFAPTGALDYESEVAIWVGSGNPLGQRIPIGSAWAKIAGFGLLNDWSARDIQRWEAQPLGPFLAKSFVTTVTPWIVTAEAIAPFRVPQPQRAPEDPSPLPHLLDPADQESGALTLAIETTICTEAMRWAGIPPLRLSTTSTLDLYWTPAQLVAHHSSNGCNLGAGDLFGTGTISGTFRQAAGCLLEYTENGALPIELPSGETRQYLHDGDEITMRGYFQRDGYVTIGTGANIGRVAPADVSR